MLKLTSRSNEKVKNAVKLRNDASDRKKQCRFFLEGLRLCCDAALSGIPVDEVFVTEAALQNHGDELSVLFSCCNDVFIVTDEISFKLSDTKNPQGVFCICKTIDKINNKDKIDYNGIYIAMENLQIPSNLGSTARTAEALGIDGLIISGGCDIYNPKTLRASMGSLLRLNIIETDDLPDFLCVCAENGMKTYAAVPDSSAMSVTSIDKSGGVVCVVGNEGNGLTDKTIYSCSERVTIPMQGKAESLNAAAAACIIMWEMKR